VKFYDQYKHPLWQKKRLEVMAAAGFACQCCGEKEAQLHVHHIRYVKGRKVWEYNSSELLCLCDECHEGTHKEKDVFDDVLCHSDGWFSYLELACVVRGLVRSSLHPDVEEGMRKFDKKLFVIGEFIGYRDDFSSDDIKTILSLSPDEFHALAKSVRGE
jgi:hypothetical protein